MTCINFTPDLYDLGGQHVCWDPDMQCPVQDPTTGGTNMYCGGSDVFQNANGDTYYRVSMPDGTVYVLNHVTPPSQQQSQVPGSQQGVSRPGSPSTNNPQSPGQPIPSQGSPVHSAAPGSATLVRTTTSGSGAGTGSAVAGGLGGIGSALTQQLQVGGFNLPVWAWAGGGLLLVSTVQRMRRR